MIAVWIVAAAFIISGGLYGFPKLIKLLTCKGRVQGTISGASFAPGTGDQPMRAMYVYTVDGVEYKKKTPYTNFAHFSKDCEVRYDKKNPKRSYIRQSGMVINAVLGTAFVIVGIGVIIVGFILKAKLGIV